MSERMESIEEPGRRALGWVLFLLVPTGVSVAVGVAFSNNWVPATGGAWVLYEVIRPISYVGLLVASGIALWVATRHTASRVWEVLMGLSIASAVVMLWYAAHFFKYTH
jgi:hypothetical protein